MRIGVEEFMIKGEDLESDISWISLALIQATLLRITVPRDSFKIISVGPIQERNLINSINNGRFVPIGNQLEESAQIDAYMKRISL